MDREAVCVERPTELVERVAVVRVVTPVEAVERVVVAVERPADAVERVDVAVVRVVEPVERLVTPVERVAVAVVAVVRVAEPCVVRELNPVEPAVRAVAPVVEVRVVLPNVLRLVALLRAIDPPCALRFMEPAEARSLRCISPLRLRSVLVERISRALVIPLLRRTKERSGLAAAYSLRLTPLRNS